MHSMGKLKNLYVLRQVGQIVTIVFQTIIYTGFTVCFIWTSNLVSHSEKRKQIKDV
jgi:hypothetical protein